MLKTTRNITHYQAFFPGYIVQIEFSLRYGQVVCGIDFMWDFKIFERYLHCKELFE